MKVQLLLISTFYPGSCGLERLSRPTVDTQTQTDPTVGQFILNNVLFDTGGGFKDSVHENGAPYSVGYSWFHTARIVSVHPVLP